MFLSGGSSRSRERQHEARVGAEAGEAGDSGEEGGPEAEAWLAGGDKGTD